MRKLILFKVFTLLLLSLFFACSDNNEDPVVEISKGQEQINEIIKELEKQLDVKEFTSVLKNLEDVNIEESQLTLFAVRDKNTFKATSTDTTSLHLTPQVIKRHIAKGRYNLKNTDFGKPLIVLSITNDTLIITKKDNEYFVNGIAIDSSREPILVGNSYVYVVNSIIPDTKDQPNITEYKVIFNVTECNPSWSETNYQSTIVSNNASIIILEKGNDSFLAIDSLATDPNGTAIYTHDGKKQLYYTILKKNQGLLAGGFFVNGSFTTQEQVDNAYRIYSGNILEQIPPYIGGPSLVDLNGDGRINELDKTSSDILPITYDSGNEVQGTFTANNCLTPSINWLSSIWQTKTNYINGFQNSYLFQRYNDIDNLLIKGAADYPQLKTSESASHYFISGALSAINNFNRAESLFNRTDCPPGIKNDWKQESRLMNLETILLQSMLYNYYGEQPILGDTKITSTEADEYLLSQLDASIMENAIPEKYIAMSLKSRILLKNKKWAEVVNTSKEVVNSNQYALSAYNDSINQPNEKEIILGGYRSTEKSRLSNPIRYPEVLLTLSEALVELGQTNDAIIFINQLNIWIGREVIYGNLTTDQARSQIQKLWTLIYYDKEGHSFRNIKRWGIFESTLASKGAKSYNKLLPIPSGITTQYGWIQNPGY